MSIRRILLLAPLAATIAAPASAHTFMKELEARAGYQEILTLGVPHGCGASQTIEIRVKVPEGIASLVPQAQPGWQVTVTTRKLDKPIHNEAGRAVLEVPDEVTWKGSLPSNQLGLFNFLALMPDKPGARLYFKTVQTCAEGETRWTETIAETEEMWRIWLKPKPSPYLVLKAAKPQFGVDPQILAKALAEKQGAK